MSTSYSFSALCMTVLLKLHSASVASENLGIGCKDNGAFYCHETDPGFFTRCIEHELYLFQCPEGLHFNTVSQTCDWPKNADCGGAAARDNARNKRKRSKVPVMHDAGRRSWNNMKANDGASSDISASAGGKPWWRPEGVDPSNWDDVNNLVEVPYDGSVGSISASVSGKKKASSSGKSFWKKKQASSSAAGKSESGKGKSEGGEGKSESGKGESEGGEGKSESGKGKSEGGEGKSESGKGKGGGWEAKGGEEKGSGGHHHPHKTAISDDTVHRKDLDSVDWLEGPCKPSECQLPKCRCPGTDIPAGLSAKSIPQMVMLTFDDEVSAAYYGYFQRLFRPGRYNPNGCPVRGCLFVSGSGTDYDLVYPMYAMGMEIASHTLSHKFPHTWWATASYQEYVDEVEGMRKKLVSDAGVPYEAIKGFRVPFLQVGADNMYKSLYDNKFVYDTSMFTGSVWEGSDPVWPFTLDYSVPDEFCQHKPCPKKQYPGFWEIPVQRWYGVDGISCAMPDGCTASADAEEDMEFFRSNFKRYYESNRAPLGIFVHARWFHTEHHLDALDRFIDELMYLEDVYIVTPIQVIEWMKNPTSLDKIKSFKPWGCEGVASKGLSK
ncbi:hypothetical protein V1264_020012 [Littorina saxatilis]|uniref:Chitin-binding type-2 domain-containing protein n=1 Tax=Littorina saxatilis TaxID=31220 RepID=A0AAN9BA85_9CAEN